MDEIPSDTNEFDPAYPDCQAWPLQTPDNLPDMVASRRLFVPDSVQWRAAVNGALSILTTPEYWRQNIIAGITPEQAAERAAEIFWDYVDSERWMIGTIVAYATTQPPPYTLPCNGGIYNRVDYPELYGALAPAFRVNADLFYTPDLLGRTIIGAAEPYPLNVAGGQADHVLTIAEMPAHSHIAQPHSHTDSGHAHPEVIAIPIATTIGLEPPEPSAIPGSGVTGAGFANIQPATVEIDSTGGDGVHNNMQPYLPLNYAIYYR